VSAKQAVVACLAALAALFGCRSEPAIIHVEFKLVDENNQPVAGVPLRIVAGIADWESQDWRGADTGERIVTAPDGSAQFTTEGVVDRRWQWVPVGFTPFSIPLRAHHMGVGFEAARVLSGRGGDVTHHLLYTADVSCFADGTCSSDDIDRVYEQGPDKRFTRLLVTSASSPNAVTMIDGIALTGSAFQLADFRFESTGRRDNREWVLRLTLKQMPKPVLR
jgi:hypothetical protein